MGPAAGALLGEDDLAVADDVELGLLAPYRRRVDSGISELGRETRGPSVVSVSDGAVEDLDGHWESLYSRPVARADRQTVDLSAYPDLVVIYLGQRVNNLRGLWTTFKLGPAINRAVKAKPDGLLLHESITWGLFPPHFGMRQYWRDFDSLERWARSLPHQEWWKNFLRDTGGTGFWHETYFLRGGMESIFDSVPGIGLSAFAPTQPARGRMFGARTRAGIGGEAGEPPALAEEELYRS